MISNVKFSNFRSPFQKELSKTVMDIKRTDDIILKADKTTNLYKVSKTTYEKLLLNNITKDYMKTTPQTVTDINNEAKTIATSLELANRIEEYGDGTAFITLKDHKENFCNLLAKNP